MKNVKHVKLEQLCKMQSGGTPSRKNIDYWDNGDILWAKISDLENSPDGYIYDTEEKITSIGLNSINNRFFPINTLFLAMYGSVGKVAISKKEMSTNQAILGINIIDEKVLDIKYLKFWFYNTKTELLDKAVGVALKNISLGLVKNLEIPLPPLATQKAIAEKLDKADALRKKDQELLKQYDELAQSIFIEMFGDPVQNEKGWEKNYLEDLTNLITDGKHGNCNDEKDSGYYFISAKDIFNGKINYSKSRQIPKSEFDEVDRRTNLQINDLVMVNTGATIGKMAVVENEILTRKTTFQKSVAVIKPLHNLINVNFLKYVFELRIDAFANIGSGTAIKNLLLSDMRKFKIISPPLELQNQFAEKIKNIETQKELVKKQAEASENLFQALLQESFSFT